MEEQRTRKNPELCEEKPHSEAGEPVAPETEKAPAQRMPARYNLYSRLNVSLKTMDIIITVIVILIVAALIVGLIWK